MFGVSRSEEHDASRSVGAQCWEGPPSVLHILCEREKARNQTVTARQLSPVSSHITAALFFSPAHFPALSVLLSPSAHIAGTRNVKGGERPKGELPHSYLSFLPFPLPLSFLPLIAIRRFVITLARSVNPRRTPSKVATISLRRPLLCSTHAKKCPNSTGKCCYRALHRHFTPEQAMQAKHHSLALQARRSL